MKVEVKSFKTLPKADGTLPGNENRLVEEWVRCYPSKWQGVRIKPALSHPAKFSSALIERIYAPLFHEGWLERGQAVLDPFGGVGAGAWPALRRGVHWVG